MCEAAYSKSLRVALIETNTVAGSTMSAQLAYQASSVFFAFTKQVEPRRLLGSLHPYNGHRDGASFRIATIHPEEADGD